MELIFTILAIVLCNQINTFATEMQPLEELPAIEYIQPATTMHDGFATLPVNLPNKADNSAKAYMDYKKITDETSAQFALIHGDTIFINDKGFLQDADGFQAVAMGSYFGRIGTRYIITLSSGEVLKVIKVDEKQDIHTCEENIYDAAGGIIEFIIDGSAEYMQANVANNGYIFQGNFNNCAEYRGDILQIEKVINDKCY